MLNVIKWSEKEGNEEITERWIGPIIRGNFLANDAIDGLLSERRRKKKNADTC